MEIKIKNVRYDTVGVCFSAKIELAFEHHTINITESVARQIIEEASRANKLEVEQNGTDLFYYIN